MKRKRLKVLTYVYWSNTFIDPGERKKQVHKASFPENLGVIRGLSWLSGPVVLTLGCTSIRDL